MTQITINTLLEASQRRCRCGAGAVLASLLLAVECLKVYFGLWQTAFYLMCLRCSFSIV